MNLLKNQQEAETIDSVYIDLEAQLMQNIARHLRDWKQPIDTDRWLIQKLAEVGKLNKENIKIIAQMSGISQTAAERMLNAMAEEIVRDTEPGFQYLARQHLIDAVVDAEKSKNIRQVMKNLQKQAKDALNLTNTTMLYKAQEAFRSLVQNTAEEALKIMNSNAAAVITGAESRQQALRKTIRQFNAKGITGFVDKRGRNWTPEAYVNMAMRTTAGSVANEVQTARCADMGVNLIQIDSHSGARPKCAKDQGKIFSLDNTSGTTEDLSGRKIRYYPWNSSSYGEPDGILGINCGHHKFPFVPGVNIQRNFLTEDMDANNRLYKQTQVQRALERDVRKQTRQQALRKTIRQFNAKGITGFVDKRGRNWTPEAYVNMAMRTTAGSVANEVQTARCADMGVNLIQIDSHSGARPKCAKDQGKIFSLDNTSGTTEDLSGRKIRYYPWNSSSYGEPDGILGINCGHHKFPFVPGVNIQRNFLTEDMDANNRLYKQTQVQRALERDVRKQKRECMIFDELGDSDAFEEASVKLKSKEAQLKDYVNKHDHLHRRKDREQVECMIFDELGDSDAFEEASVKLKSKEAQLKDYVNKHDHLHRRKDREQVVGFDKRISGEAVASKNRIAKQANSMYDTGSEAGNIKAYYRDKPLREKIQSPDTKKELEQGQFKKHVPGSHEYEQYQEKYRRQNQFGPSYLTIDEKKAQELVDKYAGTGILRRNKDGSWANEEIITVHPQDVGMAVNNLDGKEAPTSVFKIKYGKKGTHIVPDYPSKKGAKARR